MAPERSPTRDIPALTGLRGLAALAVVIFHSVVIYTLLGPGWPGPGLATASAFGWVGVDFFFVLSGFLLALPFLHRPPRALQLRTLGSYMFRRFLRIAPAYYAAIILVLAVTRNLDYLMQEPQSVLLHVLFLHNLRPETWEAISGPFWTLATEFQFYLILPFVALLFVRRWWPISLAALLAISVSWRAWAYIPEDEYYYVWLSSHVPGFAGHFALGIAAARLYLSGFQVRVPAWLLQSVVLAALVVAFLVFHVPRGEVPGLRPVLVDQRLLSHLFFRLVLAILFALLLLSAATQTSRFATVLRARPTVWLGNVSYSLYLLHATVEFLLASHLPSSMAYGYPVFMTISVAASLAAAALGYWAFERPFLRLKARMFPRRQPQAVTDRAEPPYPA
jgi:peptidoglycan/LPS O-acetylase OafA/YrhL